MKTVLSLVVALLVIGCSEEKQVEKIEKTVVVKEKNVTVVTPKKKEVLPIVKKEVQAEIKIVKVKDVVKKEKIIIVSEVNGADIFKKCSGCHGSQGQNKALNKSAVIQGWESQQVVRAINGYINGTYGGSMKSVMKPQVSKLSDAEIKAVAKYISDL